jgi:serine/threonine protein kinase
MSNDTAHRAEAIFLEAVGRSDASRERYLADACGTDDQLRGEVDSLLAHHEASGAFLATPVLEVRSADRSSRATQPQRPCDDPRLPAERQLGPYELIDVLGVGGMGIVYLARQRQPQRTVALKVIQPGVTSEAMLVRFEHETQLLGRLQHSGIAQIYDAGTADTGAGPQPYFAMEYVEGQSLLKYARASCLSLRQRIELMARICAPEGCDPP